MLIDFTVQNFRSIKNSLTLTLEARQSLTDHTERLMSFKKDMILPQVMILGPNASGKSNILKAFSRGILILKESVYQQPGDKIPFLEPFKLDDDSRNSATSFEYTFTMNNQRFIYGFSADQNVIQEEYLYSFTANGKRESQSTQFERKLDEYYIPAKNKRLNKLTEMTAPNKLFLAVAASFNNDLSKKIFEYLVTSFITASPTSLAQTGRRIILESEGTSEKTEILRLLHKADFCISDFKIESESKTFQDMWKEVTRQELPEAFADFADKKDYIDLSETTHCVDDKCYKLLLSEESAGTRHYLYMLPVILDTLKNGRVLLVDEIESSLHPMLIREITRLFNDQDINTRQAQLIFTTHDILLLGIGDSRRDQIFMVEKNRSDETTDLYTLADFSPRKDENILKNYLIGRYGAIPQITEDYIDG